LLKLLRIDKRTPKVGMYLAYASEELLTATAEDFIRRLRAKRKGNEANCLPAGIDYNDDRASSRQRHSPLGHHLGQIAQAELVAKLVAHTQNNDPNTGLTAFCANVTLSACNEFLSRVLSSRSTMQRGRDRQTVATPTEQPPRKLSGKRTAQREHLESGALVRYMRPPKGISRLRP
jgi:hypothetical protein